MPESVVHFPPSGRRATPFESAAGAAPTHASVARSQALGTSTGPIGATPLQTGPALLRLVRLMGRQAARADLAAAADDRPLPHPSLKDPA